MKTRVLILLTLIIAMTAISCKSRDKGRFPDSLGKVTEFATIPSHKAMFLALDRFEETTISRVQPFVVRPALQDTMHIAFAWGVLTSDLQLAVRSRDTSWLETTLTRLSEFSPILELEEIIAKIAINVKPMLEQENWNSLENTFYNMQYSIEQMLFEQEEYEIYTLMALGGWTETTYQIASQIISDFQTEITPPLLQEEAWQSLEANLGLIQKDSYVSTSAFKKALAETSRMREILSLENNETLSLEQVGDVVSSTTEIKKAFLKLDL